MPELKDVNTEGWSDADVDVIILFFVFVVFMLIFTFSGTHTHMRTSYRKKKGFGSFQKNQR
jgi:hypothetical protein